MKPKNLAEFFWEKLLQFENNLCAAVGVSNGLCEHWRTGEQCVYICKHEQRSYPLSCEQPALMTCGEQRARRKFWANRNLSFEPFVLRKETLFL